MYGDALSDPGRRVWKRGQRAWLIAWFQPSIAPWVAPPAPDSPLCASAVVPSMLHRGSLSLSFSGLEDPQGW